MPEPYRYWRAPSSLNWLIRLSSKVMTEAEQATAQLRRLPQRQLALWPIA